MAGITFEKGALVDVVSDQVGYKAGLALSIKELCDSLSDTDFDGLITQSEKSPVRLHSSEYERLFYKLLHKVGHTEEEFNGDKLGLHLWHKYSDHRDVVQGVVEIFVKTWPIIIDETMRLEKENGIYYFLMDYARSGSFVARQARSLFQDGEIALREVGID